VAGRTPSSPLSKTEKGIALETMRERFARVATDLLDTDPRVAVVLADITADAFEPARQRHPDRGVNLGIREQLLISVAQEVTAALADLPHRVLGLGVAREELRNYGTPEEHQAAHGLDPASLRERIATFVAGEDPRGGGRNPARALA
jgi:hypothetical protein